MQFESIERTKNRPHITDERLKEFAQPIINIHQNPFRKFLYRRLLADRDMSVEADKNDLKLGPEGANATNILQRYYNQEELPRHLIEQTVLGELNTIYGEDAHFRRILPRRKEKAQNDWEIYLEEEAKGLIPMSHTGSGVKTILLVLMNLFIVPHVVKKPLSQFIFAFEELENNLHPAIQRRLFRYLAEKARKEKCRFFITTHSHIVIDLFSGDGDAQIIHVQHDGTSAKVSAVSTFFHNRSILRDLDVRASDLLQSNAVIWVEGPSDRIYFNHWIKLWTGGLLKEGVHYEFAYSAGSLLAHYSFAEPCARDAGEAEEELVQALRINPHAIVLIDSDKRKEDDGLKPRARRVVDEVEQMDGVAWVTAGKEVENYIPPNALAAILHGSEAPGCFDDFFSFVTGPQGGRLDKVKLARNICPNITREMLESHLDLASRLEIVCQKIREWNGTEPTPVTSPSQS